MQQWEYLQLASAAGLCTDNYHRVAGITAHHAHAPGEPPVFTWGNFGPALNELGAERWHLIGLVETGGVLNFFFKRPRGPASGD